MPQLILVLLALGGLWWLSRFFLRANPAALARLIQQGSGAAALVGAGLLLLRGQIEIAVGLAGLGLYLLGFSSTLHWSGVFRKSAKTAGRSSKVRSALIEMALDHDTGAMAGRVVGGSFAGRALASLTRSECEALAAVCAREDPDGARLLEAYLDRRFAGRRGAGEGDADGGGRRGGAGKMSEDEAYEVLGLQKGAAREDVTRAHRALMQKLHPDHGGTTNLAAQVNEAKDILLRRHT